MAFHKIALSCQDPDSGMKAPIIQILNSLDIEILNFPSEPGNSDNLYVENAAEAVSKGAADGAIVLGKTGLEGSVIGNKFAGVRASLATTPTTAMYTRCHNSSNLLSIGEQMTGRIKILDIVKAWLQNEFQGGRHAISVGMICEGEQFQFGITGERTAAPTPTRWPIRRVIVGNDHAGYEAKAVVLPLLEKRGIQYVDIGTGSTDIVRYPYYAARVDQAVLCGEADAGILLCGTGIGMSIAANKFSGIRATLCNDKTAARLARETLDANVLCLGGKIVGTFELTEIVEQWLDSPYAGGAEQTLRQIQTLERNTMQRTDWRPAHSV